MPERKRILIIDDTAAVCAVMRDTLTELGYAVSCAANGVAGLDRITLEGPPDLVITDIIMPRKTGLETIRDIRAVYPRVPIIAISGGGRERAGDLLEEAALCGCNAALAKPINMTQFEDTVRRLAG
ncbi:MAG: response regulator [Alphaproteobacteria bacterium]|nr:response regulator [Alphaproteobacteria bacterium]USO08363.1 MAG: response regulator [Rhodospirillales bacterium]